MKSLTSFLFSTLFVLIAFASCQQSNEKAKRPQIPIDQRKGVEATNERPKVDNVNLNGFKDLYNSGKYMIIDARSQKEFLDGHLPEAILMDYDASDFDDVASKLDSTSAYLIYSHKGIKSVKTMSKLNSKGIKDITNLIGGISAWQVKKYPWTK